MYQSKNPYQMCIRDRSMLPVLPKLSVRAVGALRLMLTTLRDIFYHHPRKSATESNPTEKF